jgi:8-oxo-dGTP diphosphatase
MSYTYKFPRPSVTADCVVFNCTGNTLSILLVQRKAPPFIGQWAFPGGFIEMEEDLEESASRELKEETGLEWSGFEQIGAFGKLGRDPRGRTITVAFMGFVMDTKKARAGSDAAEVQWFDIKSLPPMAFDHHEIFGKAVELLKIKFLLNDSPFNLTKDVVDCVKKILDVLV